MSPSTPSPPDSGFRARRARSVIAILHGVAGVAALAAAAVLVFDAPAGAEPVVGFRVVAGIIGLFGVSALFSAWRVGRG